MKAGYCLNNLLLFPVLVAPNEVSLSLHQTLHCKYLRWVMAQFVNKNHTFIYSHTKPSKTLSQASLPPSLWNPSNLKCHSIFKTLCNLAPVHLTIHIFQPLCNPEEQTYLFFFPSTSQWKLWFLHKHVIRLCGNLFPHLVKQFQRLAGQYHNGQRCKTALSIYLFI